MGSGVQLIRVKKAKRDGILEAARIALIDTRHTLNNTVDRILKKSLEVTPKDTGALRKSGRVLHVPKTAKNIMRASVRYGGKGKVIYAAFVDVMPESNDWTTPGTGPDYLRKVGLQESKGITKDAAADIKAGYQRHFPNIKARPQNVTQVFVKI